MAFSNDLLEEFDLGDCASSFGNSGKLFGTLSLWTTAGGAENGTTALELKLEFETNSAGILGEEFNPKLGVLVGIGITPFFEMMLLETEASGSGGSVGMGLLPRGDKDGEDGNEFVGLDGDGVEPGEDGISNGAKPDVALSPFGAPDGGKFVSKSFETGNCGVDDCPSGEALLFDPKMGVGELPKESKPMDELTKLPVASGPLGPETSGKLSSPMKPSRSGFIGFSVPLSATYPPYKTKSNNTTTTAVFKVCTAVLPDRKFYKILFTDACFVWADCPGTPDARIDHSGKSTSIVPPASWIPKVFSIGLQVIA